MRTFKAHVYFQDEVPRIGAGYRHVVVRVGRVWLRFEELGTGKRARMQRFPLDGRTMKRYDALAKTRMRGVVELA